MEQDALTVKLVTLIAPNFPFLAGTNIAVTDAEACARRGTPGQRATGKQVRRTLDDIWELDEDQSTRQLLERLSKTSGSQEGCDRLAETGSPRLPMEVYELVINNAIHDTAYFPLDLDFVVFMRLRQVSKVTRHLVHTRFPNTFARFLSRVARSLPEEFKRGSTVRFAQHVYSVTPLFSKASTLAVAAPQSHDQADALTMLLSACKDLEELFVHLGRKEIWQGRMDLSHLSRLKAAHLIGGKENRYRSALERPVPSWARASDFTRVPLHDQEGQKTSQWANQLSLPKVLPILYLVNIADLSTVAWWHQCQVEQVAIRGTDFEPELVEALQGSRGSLESLSFEAGAMDEEAAANLHIHLLPKLDELHLRAVSRLWDPAALSLATNTSISELTLEHVRMESLQLGLSTNTCLRRLSLEGSFVYLREGGLSDLLPQLRANRTLEHLSLADNYIDDAALSIAGSWEDVHLRSLDLSRNQFSGDGLQEMHLELNKTLEFIDLYDNDDLYNSPMRELAAARPDLEVYGLMEDLEEEEEEDEPEV